MKERWIEVRSDGTYLVEGDDPLDFEGSSARSETKMTLENIKSTCPDLYANYLKHVKVAT